MQLTSFFWGILLSVGLASGCVEAHILLRAPQYQFHSPQTLTGKGGVWVQKDGMIMKGERFSYQQARRFLTMEGEVYFTHPKGIEIHCQTLSFDHSTQILTVRGRVTCRYGAIFSTSGQAQYFIKTQQVVLSDHPRAGRPGDEVVGQRIVIDLHTKRVFSVGSAKVRISPETLEKTP